MCVVFPLCGALLSQRRDFPKASVAPGLCMYCVQLELFLHLYVGRCVPVYIQAKARLPVCFEVNHVPERSCQILFLFIFLAMVVG